MTSTVITSVVLPILVFQLTGSALNTALLAAFNVVPYLAFGLFAGALADRVNRRVMMVTCDLINTGLLLSLPLAASVNALTLPHIYAVALLSATAFVWFDAANFGALATLVGRERVPEAKSAIWTAQTVAGVLGPALGGWSAANLGAASTLLLDSASYRFSAIALALITRAFNIARVPQTASNSLVRRTLADIAEGLRFIWRYRLIRPLMVLGWHSPLRLAGAGAAAETQERRAAAAGFSYSSKLNTRFGANAHIAPSTACVS